MALTRKRLLLIGFILVLLIGIPATLYVVQQQQELRSRAEKATVLYFQPESTQPNPIIGEIGEPITLELYANPGTNLISNVRLEIIYDATKLATPSAEGQPEAFVPNMSRFPQIVFGPVYTPGKIAVTLSTGGDPTNIVDTVQQIGTLTLIPIAETGATPTRITYGPNTLVTSGGDESQFAEDVLSSTNPAFVLIQGDTPITITPIPDTPTPTTETPTPIVITGEPGPQGPAGPQGPQGPAGPQGPVEEEPTPEFTLAPTATETPVMEEPATATPTMAASGPGDVVVGFGIFAAILTVIGGILFFAL